MCIRDRLWRYAAASLAMLAVCAALYFSRGVPQRYSELATIEAPTLALAADPCLAASQVKPNLSPCLLYTSRCV